MAFRHKTERNPMETPSVKIRRKRFPAAENRCAMKSGITQEGQLGNALYDECLRRGSDLKAMAAELGVTYGYVNQLRSGVRSAKNLSQRMTEACARYLGVAPIVVKMTSGQIPFSDFICPAETEEAAVERLVRRMQTDIHMPFVNAAELCSFPFEAKKAMAMMYSRASPLDMFGINEIPAIARELQLAAMALAEPNPQSTVNF